MEIATALKQGLRVYNAKIFAADLTAAFVVSLVALPLSMALAIAVGLPPEHGIYTAIIAGIAAALLGGSTTQVSGPTAAFVVIVAPIVAQFGISGIIWCQILAGIILIIFGVLKLGKYISYVPYPVVTGFTAGIAVTIALISLNDFLGLGIEKLDGSFFHKSALIAQALPHFNRAESFVGISSLLVMLVSHKYIKFIPSPITGIIFAGLAAYLAKSYGYEIQTIGTKFNGIPAGLPPFAIPELPDFRQFEAYIKPALVIAALAALESLLSASVADGMAGTKHKPNAELNGIGVANILSGLFSGIPATGAIARTATNINAGAKTPIAACLHSLFILAYVLVFAPYISYVPMAALSALLLITAYRMSHVRHFLRIIRIGTKGDAIVLLSCFFFTVIIDMVAGVTIGILLASLLFLKASADIARISIIDHNIDARLSPENLIVKIEGPIFFGSSDIIEEQKELLNSPRNTYFIDVSQVPFSDITGVIALKLLIVSLSSKSSRIVISGNKSILKQIRKKLPRKLPAKVIFTKTPDLYL